MKTKILAFTLLALALSACNDSTDEAKDKAKGMGLECINGWVFHKHTEYPLLRSWKTTYEPLNVECPSGKVEVK